MRIAETKQSAGLGAQEATAEEVCEGRVVVAVRDGLHARPAALLAKLAKSFAADVEIVCKGKQASAKSSVKLMLLAVTEGDEVLVRTRGADAAVALARVIDYLATPGGEPAPAAPTPRSTETLAPPKASASEALQGVAASEGVAMGPAFPYRPLELEVPHAQVPPQERASELERYGNAVEATVGRLAAAKEGADAGILAALVEIVHDTDLRAEVERIIAGGGDAVTAAIEAGATFARRFEELDDTYLRARAADIRAVTRAIALTLCGLKDPSLADVPPGAIIVADELNAWDLLKAPVERIGGIVCRRGSATAHTAIVARTHGIPAVLGCASLREIEAGTLIALDGGSGEVFVAPNAATMARMEAAIGAQRAAAQALSVYRTIAPRTRSGVAIRVEANLGSLSEIEAALSAGAMGVGLFRTELMFMERKRLLSEDEQADAYLRLAEAFKPMPVIVRTLDVGGDKPIPGLEIPHEDNPFLGWRGVRLCLDRPDVFAPQIKALLRGAVHGNLKIMLPMVSDVEEVRQTRALMEACGAELAGRGVAHGMPELGVMIETPAAVLLAEELAAEVRFFSIGTNDLTQYVMAADRLNPRVAKLNSPAHPAVLRAIALACAAARKYSIPVGVCGEAAAQPSLIPELLRLGVTELSMAAASIRRAKKIICDL